MRLIYQQVASGVPGEGDCVTTCVASFLGRPLDAMPDLSGWGCLSRGESQSAGVIRFLQRFGFEARAMCLEEDFNHNGEEWRATRIDTTGLAFAFAYLSGDFMPPEDGLATSHCLIMEDGQLFWDPWAAPNISFGPLYTWIFPTRRGRRLRARYVYPRYYHLAEVR